MNTPSSHRPSLPRAGARLGLCCALGFIAVSCRASHPPSAVQPADAPNSFFASGGPGTAPALINASGFTLFPNTNEAIAFRVTGLSREQGSSLAWHGGVANPSENEVLFTGERMAVHYAASAAGVRQNFLVFDRPAGTGPLNVGMELTTTLASHLDASDVVSFRSSGRTVITYRDLHCWDADHAPLAAHFVLTDRQLNIVVDDANATYPITVDPVSTSPNTLIVSPGTGWNYGFAVATAGDLNGDGYSDVVIGAPQANLGLPNEGAAYVRYGTSNGIQTAADVTLRCAQQGAQFGSAVSSAGDVNGDGYSDLIVGARTWESDVATQLSEGAVFVYFGSATGIATTPDQILQTDHPGDNFGSNAACAGDVNDDGFSDVIVGAYLAGYPTVQEGAAFIYLGSASGLNTSFANRLERNQGSSHFGRSVSPAGDVNGDGYSDVIVGAPHWTVAPGSDQGTAFVYYGGESGIGATQNPPPALQLFGSGLNSAAYGWWVSSAGDLNGDGYSEIAIGAYQDQIGAGTGEGAVYVYNGTASGLVTAPSAVLQSNQDNAWMGRCVSTAGDINGDGYADLMVGIPRFGNGQGTEGVVRVYLGSAGGISTTHTFQLEINNAGANFGENLCTAGDVNGDGISDMIVGGLLYGSGGAAAVFLGGTYSSSLTPSLVVSGNAANEQLGASMASAGDVNGDGYADALFGAPNALGGEGQVFLHYGSATGIAPTPSVTLQMNVANAAFGTSVASAGDVNGDGYSDVVVGAPQAFGNGRAYLFLGSAGGLSTTPGTVLSGGSAFGASVSGAGDMNSDGFADVIVGAPGTGEAYVFNGSFPGLSATPLMILSIAPASGHFGAAVAGAGDVNGDGFGDVIVGAPDMANGQAGEGLAYLYHGASAGPVNIYAKRLECDQVNAHFGTSVASAGDANGDGFSDVTIGADLWESGQTDEGAAFVYYGSLTGIKVTGFTTLQRNIVDGRMGNAVAEAGDVNGDGYGDVVVGAYLSEVGPADEGVAYVYKGSPAGTDAINYDLLRPNVAANHFGQAVGGAGDLDGDGYSDVIVGSPNASATLIGQGASTWYRGGADRALGRITRQYCANLATPLSVNGTDLADPLHFGVGHLTRNPIQRSKARLRWEVVFQGQPFSGAPITNSVTQTGTAASWTALNGTGSELKQLIDKAPGQRRYKWRVREEYQLAKLIDGQRFSRWFYGAASGTNDIGVLPIELLRFQGEAMGAVNSLEWTTASERNTDHFELLRSANATALSLIGEVPAAGESSAMLNYSFTDDAPSPGTNYYRLRSVDTDGASQLSDIIAIERTANRTTLFPNPVADQLSVDLNVPVVDGKLYVLDALGRTVRTMSVHSDNSTMHLCLDLTSLVPGSYTLMLRDTQGTAISAAPFVKR